MRRRPFGEQEHFEYCAKRCSTKCVSCLCSLPSNDHQAEAQNCSNPKKDNAPFVAVLKMVVAASKNRVAGEKWSVAATITSVTAKKLLYCNFF
jgi:hypothetical protein